MKPKTKNSTLFDKMLCGIVLTALVVADVLTILVISMSPLWSTSVIEAFFWSLVMIGTIGSLNLLSWGMMKETFNK